MLTTVEERKFLECDEAIEAIDATIEYKNELLCGRRDLNSESNSSGEQVCSQENLEYVKDFMLYFLYNCFRILNIVC